jgi:hypothetical protein
VGRGENIAKILRKPELGFGGTNATVLENLEEVPNMNRRRA